MRNAADYLAHIKALIIMNPQVVYWSIETFPHHIHDGSEDNVRPYHPITAESFLSIMTAVPEGHSGELGEEE